MGKKTITDNRIEYTKFSSLIIPLTLYSAASMMLKVSDGIPILSNLDVNPNFAWLL